MHIETEVPAKNWIDMLRYDFVWKYCNFLPEFGIWSFTAASKNLNLNKSIQHFAVTSVSI
jgi:hypothetical protein